MRKSIYVGLALVLLLSSTAFADTIYLKNGKILRGKISQEDLRSFVVESGDTWQRIQRDDVEMIRTDDTPAQASGQVEKSEPAVAPADGESVPVRRKDASVEMRLKVGSAPGIDEWKVGSASPAAVTPDGGGNLQFDFVLGFYRDSSVALLMSGGVFARSHQGKTPLSKIDYDASGLAFAGGVRFNTSDHLHFEGKLEMDLGSGMPKPETLGITGSYVEAGSYAAASLIIGGYYTFSTPGIQLGLELGSQAFKGSFRTLSTGLWIDQNVSGGDGIVNLVAGYRF
ncbi:MAG: hypothetical protein OEW15_06505 [Nitrospirota bacterium]|nr:hypothetical protein [Nitrospirota bacterium]